MIATTGIRNTQGLKLLAIAVAGLMSSAAFAQTSVVIGGKVDAGYQFGRSANADTAAGGPTGGKTTETLTDGSASTSRITVVAKENLGSGVSAEVNMDLRFSGGYEQNKTGLTTSDKRMLILRTPILNVSWGVANLGGQMYYGVTEKPYMISPKDLEIVKFGVSQLRESSLTSRNTTIFTNPINIGPAALLFHTTYAFGDNRAAGTSNIGTSQTVGGAGQQSGGDVRAAGMEWKVTDIVSGGVDFNTRQSTNTLVATKNGMQFTHTYVNVKPLKGLKFGASFNTYKGYDGAGGDFNEKNTNFVVAYNLNDKVELGVAVSSLKDMAQSRNSGSGMMFGGAYFLTKSTYLYASHAIQRFDRNQSSIAGKYDGTASNFTTTLNKVDSHLTKVGIVKEF